MTTINIYDAKTQLSKLVEQAAAGEDVIIARGGKPVARLTRLLLDTHVFIWSVTASRQLKVATREYLASAQAVYVSAASIWEIAIKSRLGKIAGDAQDFAAAIEAS